MLLCITILLVFIQLWLDFGRNFVRKSFYKANSFFPLFGPKTGLFLIFRLSEALKEGKNKKNKSNVNVRDQVQP